jgi:hypothetical protein
MILFITGSSLTLEIFNTVNALCKLQDHFRLAIVSNVDDDLFAGTQPQPGVNFDQVITAQHAGAYKPSLSQMWFSDRVLWEARRTGLLYFWHSVRCEESINPLSCYCFKVTICMIQVCDP